MRSFKKIFAAVAVLIITAAFIYFLDIALYPCTYLRNDIHKIAVDPPDVLILGTSNAKMGIDPDQLLQGTGLKGHNLAAGSEYPVDSYFIAKYAIEKKKPQLIIYEVDPGYYTSKKENGNNYVLFYHELPVSLSKAEYSFAILKDSDLREWLFPFYEYPLKTTVPRIKDNLDKKLKGDYGIESLKSNIQEYHENGFIEKYPVSEDRFKEYTVEEFKSELVLPENVEYLEKLIKLCEQEGVPLIALSMPLPDRTIQENREKLENAWDYFSVFFREQGVDYYNFNTERYKSYSHRAVHFVDYDGHLNGESAREFSGLFGQILLYNGIIN